MTASAAGGPAIAAVALAIALALGSPALMASAEVAPPPPAIDPSPTDPAWPPAEVDPAPADDTVDPGSVLPPSEEPAVDPAPAPAPVTPAPSRPRPSAPRYPVPQPSESLADPAGGSSSIGEEFTVADPEESIPTALDPAVKPNRPTSLVPTPTPSATPAPVVAAWNVDYTTPIAGAGTPTLAVIALAGSLAAAASLVVGAWLYRTRWANRVTAGPFRRR